MRFQAEDWNKLRRLEVPSSLNFDLGKKNEIHHYS